VWLLFGGSFIVVEVVVLLWWCSGNGSTEELPDGVVA
jgi:hypothetical protein